MVVEYIIRARKLRQVFDLVAKYGGRDRNYIGEPISQLDHAAQAAMLAEKDGASKPVILAAFLHDIGHMVHADRGYMGSMGNNGHEEIGSNFLRSYRFPYITTALIKGHVNSKRYLCTINDNYREKLSSASKETMMEYQGGLMSKYELIEFIKDPLYEMHLQFRSWDDKAKSTNQELLKLISKTDLVDKYFKMATEVVSH